MKLMSCRPRTRASRAAEFWCLPITPLILWQHADFKINSEILLFLILGHLNFHLKHLEGSERGRGTFTWQGRPRGCFHGVGNSQLFCGSLVLFIFFTKADTEANELMSD